MLPNFRRSEPEASDTHSSPFQPRPFLSVPRSAGEAAKSVSIIGAGLTITGNLSCKGEVQVDGIVEGDIQGSHVVIGEDATVTGSISGEEVIVRGHVVGSVRGRRVMLQTTSQVEGDIYHQSLSIEQGALFEGKSRRTKEDPRTIETKSEPIPFVAPPRLPEHTN
ncbi:polymer-forming cytoskeletal protein [Hyphomicrobium sp.]|uniref:bactofilin family protein n=1 Tax=Hyphomicrobium sp. TaxID=82 RepID=UPI000FB9E116|nr:polymer-forming cytoskeletal protein [Hyphomicrobium sp.]RUO99369.1 MAG: polymer-forming cytoskeletal protein [Hyphomicrobium sp.]